MNHSHVAQREIDTASPKLLIDKCEHLLRELLRSDDMRTVGSAHPQTELPGIHRGKNIAPQLRADGCNQQRGGEQIYANQQRTLRKQSPQIHLVSLTEKVESLLLRSPLKPTETHNRFKKNGHAADGFRRSR